MKNSKENYDEIRIREEENNRGSCQFVRKPNLNWTTKSTKEISLPDNTNSDLKLSSPKREILQNLDEDHDIAIDDK
jgi:hypothetical protein